MLPSEGRFPRSCVCICRQRMGKGHWPAEAMAQGCRHTCTRAQQNCKKDKRQLPCGLQDPRGQEAGLGSPSTTVTAPESLAGMAIPNFTLQTTTSKNRAAWAHPYLPAVPTLVADNEGGHGLIRAAGLHLSEGP